ncbi:MAG: hypothetical protein HY096_01585 [Nitrospinae bacterium]|nr:hypothetical protein [Nitrospinota bacterium]
MPKLDEHIAESILLFGKSYREVHIWLDALAGSPQCGMKHRQKRHHKAGLEQVRRIFGEEAVQAARQHIITDLKMEGWTENDPFPKDEQHYIRMGLF